MSGGNLFLIPAHFCSSLFLASQEVQPLSPALQRSQQVAASSADGASPRKSNCGFPWASSRPERGGSR